MEELFDLYARHKRVKEEPGRITLMIEIEGGHVLGHRQVNRLVPSPFKGFRAFPILYEFASDARSQAVTPCSMLFISPRNSPVISSPGR